MENTHIQFAQQCLVQDLNLHQSNIHTFPSYQKTMQIIYFNVLNQAVNLGILIMTTTPSAKCSKPNQLELHLNHCSILTNHKWVTIVIEESTVEGLRQYQNAQNGNFSFSTLNCGVGGDKVQNVLQQAQNLPTVENFRNVVILCVANNLHLNAPEDIADNIIKIGLTFKRLYANANAFICQTLPTDNYCQINRIYNSKAVNNFIILKILTIIS